MPFVHLQRFPAIQTDDDQERLREMIYQLEALGMHKDDADGIPSALKEFYQNVRKQQQSNPELWRNWLIHLVVMSVDMEPVGVALVENNYCNALHLFVKEEHRRRGYGEKMLQMTLLFVKQQFGVFYTETSQFLYKKYDLKDIPSGDYSQ